MFLSVLILTIGSSKIISGNFLPFSLAAAIILCSASS
jgi:hypothetical protein